jgi:hypothetical protein
LENGMAQSNLILRNSCEKDPHPGRERPHGSSSGKGRCVK